MEGSTRALVIDPGDDADRICEELKAHALTVERFLITHGHMDHVYALAGVRERFPAPVSMHPLDAAWAFTDRNTMPPFYSEPPRSVPVDRALAEGQEWSDAGFAYQVLHTPGHSRGSVCFYFDSIGWLFCGDVLFMDSVGRTDLPGGDWATLQASLRRLMELPDATRVFPGHGPDTTIGREREQNPFLRMA